MCPLLSALPQSRHTSSEIMPRRNSNVFQRRLSQNDGRYDLKIAICELIVYDQDINNHDKHNRCTGHVVGITPQQYYIKLFKGPLIRHKQSNCTNRICGYEKSRPVKAFEDRLIYKYATEYLVHSDSEDSQDSSTSFYRITWGHPQE